MEQPIVIYDENIVLINTTSDEDDDPHYVHMTLNDFEQWLCAQLQEVRGRMGKQRWHKKPEDWGTQGTATECEL